MGTTITEIHASGLKANANFTHSLLPKTLIVGANFTGKSSILEACILAWLGHLPHLGEKPGATMQIACGNELRVRMKTSDGAVVSREWKRGGSGVKSKHNVPDGFSDDIPLITPGAYFAMSERERIDYVFRRVVHSEYTADRVYSEIEGILDESDDVTSYDEAAVAQVLEWVRESVSGASLNHALPLLTGDDGILATEYTKYNRDQKKSQGAVQKATELRAESAGEADEAGIKSMREKHAGIQRSLSNLHQSIGALKAKIEIAKRQSARREEIKRELAAERRDYDAEILQTKNHLQAVASAAPACDPEDLKKAVELRKEVESKLRELDGGHRAAFNKAAAAERRIAELTALDICADCTKKLLNPLQSEKDNAEQEKVAIENEMALTRKRLEEASVEVERLQAEIEKRQAVDQRREELEAHVSELERAKLNEEADRAEMKEELRRLGGGEEASEEELKELEADRDVTESAGKELQIRIDAAAALLENLRLAENALDDHRREKSFATIIDKARKKLVALQEEMISKVFSQITDRANKLVGDILPSPLCYYSGQVGRMKDGYFVGHKTMTGAEQMLAYVAIAAALSWEMPSRVLFLDEMGRMSTALQGRVLKRLDEAVDRGDLDQVIGIIPRDSTINGAGNWHVIQTK